MMRMKSKILSLPLLIIIACISHSCNKVVEVSEITLSQSTVELVVDETIQLRATVLPSDATDREVIWATSKPSVATVDNTGIVTAVSKGSATITASCGGKSTTCSVEVKLKEISVTGDALDITENTARISCYAFLDADMRQQAEFGVEYSSVDLTLSGSFAKATSLNSDGSYSVTLSGLNSNTKYYYRSYVLFNGVRTFGQAKSFNTLDFNVSLAILETTNITEFRATINGKLDVATASELAKEVAFYYSNSATTTSSIVSEGIKVNSSLNADGSFSAELTNLTYNTPYHFVAYSKIHDKELYSEVATFTTADISASVVTDEVSELTMYSAVISGSMTIDMTESVDNAKVHPFFAVAKTEASLEDALSNGRINVEASHSGEVWTFKKSLVVEPGVTYYYQTGVSLYDKDILGAVKSFTAKDYPYSAVAVDLGLSVKWASYNLGATAPEEAGARFAWGETNHKPSYTTSNYIVPGGDPNFYNRTSNTTLLPEHDAAHVKLGGNWRMPTEQEFYELLHNCTWTWKTVNGMEGYEVKSKSNSNSIFLPAAGSMDGTEVKWWNQHGFYWTSSKGENDSYWARYFCMWPMSLNGGPCVGDSWRGAGNTVRAVCD